jgi:hypothetical protein
MASRGQMPALLGAALLVGIAASAAAQNPSAQTTTEMGKPVTTTTTRHISGKIVSVDGNKVVVQGGGAATEYTVPDGFKFQMGGKDVGVADLKPGMTVSATVTTSVTTTPVTVTEIRKGKVLAVSGETVIVRGPNGVRSFTQSDLEKRHVVLKNDQGQPLTLGTLHPGDHFTAIIVTDEPPKVVSEREAKAYVQAAPAPAAAAAKPAPAPAPAAAPAPAPAPAPAAAPAPAKPKMPKTASSVPLAGAASTLFLAAAMGLMFLRRARSVR